MFEGACRRTVSILCVSMCWLSFSCVFFFHGQNIYANIFLYFSREINGVFDLVCFQLHDDATCSIGVCKYGKLIDHFHQESDVTSLQDHFDTSLEVFLFICVFTITICSFNHACFAFSFLDVLASCLAVLATHIQPRLSLKYVSHVHILYICMFIYI